MYTKFAIATFCFGERYQKQTNRLINEIDKSYFKPTLVVVTDDINFIIDKPFVKKFNISDFNPEYKNYSDSYYDFDFSVKRYSLLAALNLGFTKIILCDADAVPNPSLFTEEYMIKGFEKNSIQGQVTYNFKDQINTNSELGKRFIEYEKFYNVYFDKDLLNFMPEDCIQFLDIDIPKFYNFLRVWDDCIKYKKNQNLSNRPAGNIDEMCFSALKCGITVGNNSDKCINSLTPIHDKWYDSHFTQSSVDFQEKNKKKTIVTSIYELNYIQDRGGAVYKGFHLMTETIRSIIFEEYNYVIYTDNSTYVKYNMSEVFNYPNVEIKFCELNDVFYRDVLNPIRIRKNEEGQIWDRIYSVENYIEVIYNKLVYLVEIAKEIGGDVCWVDAGLFGTSCHNGWRDHLKNNIVHNKNFVDKIFEKIESEDFIALKGNEIAINYELKDNLQNIFGSKIVIVPGGLFGGKKEYIIEYLDNFKTKVIEIINYLNDYTSEQELLYLLLEDKKCKFFDFNDWDDLQRAILKLMDLYDKDTYQTHTFKEKISLPDVLGTDIEDITPVDKILNNFTEIADSFGIDKGSLYEGHMYTKVYEKYMNDFLNKIPTIIEIGVNDARFPGGCLRFWNKIFQNMKYFGYDISDCSHLEYNRKKIQLYQGDQNNEKDLENFIEKFQLANTIDFIIDDGSHIGEHILTSFKTLFKYLKCGGVYFIEGLHAGQANREETIKKIEIFLQENFEFNFEINKDNYKLLIIKKKC